MREATFAVRASAGLLTALAPLGLPVGYAAPGSAKQAERIQVYLVQ
jgi:hypothetical protein